MTEYSQKWHNRTSRKRSTETSDGLAAIQAQLNNPGREIKKENEKVYASQVGCEHCKGPHYTKDCPQKEEGKTLKEAYYTEFVGPFQEGGYRVTTPGELVHTRLTMKLADRTVKYPKGIAENVLVGIGKFTFPVDFIILDMPEDIKVPLILERPFLSTACAKIDVYKRKITLSVGEEKIISKVSLDPFLEDYIELNDLNEPIELRRNQGDDLMPFIEEGEVIEEFRIKNEDLDTGIDDYPNFTVLENMDAYRDKGMGDVIFGEPFLREADIKTKLFEGMITLYKGDDEVNENDVMHGVSHAYQKLKGFYKGVLNLGPDYIRNAKTEEWLTCGHISVHELD
ncbi:putative reverse transcriptase domain-containing protein [Tanacetum coccineum]